jgi:NADPH-dependent FMN reductase
MNFVVRSTFAVAWHPSIVPAPTTSRPSYLRLFVTPEYNHGMPGALKNAIDYLYAEWNDKVAGFVSYGADGGARAVEQLRLVMGVLKVADVRAKVLLSLFTDFENLSVFKPDARRKAQRRAEHRAGSSDRLGWRSEGASIPVMEFRRTGLARQAALLDEMCLGPRQFVTVEEGVDYFVVEGDEAGDRRRLAHRVVVCPSDVRMNCFADSRRPVP